MLKKARLVNALSPEGLLLPVLIFALLTFAILYPISMYPSQLVIGRPFDNVFESIGYLDWYKRALMDQRISPLFNPDIFYPGGWDLRFSVMPPLFPILLSPITAVLGSVTTYNIVIMVSTITAAMGVYKLHQEMGGGIFGGIFAGLLYSFYPNRQVYMAGFLNLLLASVWLPWMLFGIYQAVNQPQKRTRWFMFTGLCYALSIASAWQYTYIGTLALLLYGGVLVGTSLRQEWHTWVKPVFTFIGVTLLIAGPWLFIGLQGQQSLANSAKFSLEDLIGTSPSLERFLLPSGMNPLTWKLTRELFSEGINENSMIFFGYITAGLALYACWRWRPWRTPEWALLVLSIGGLFFMVGPFIKWMNEPLIIPIQHASFPESISAILGAQNGLRIPMPAFFVYKLVPPFETFHHFGRIGILVALGLSIFAGLGLTTLIKKQQKIRVGHIIGLVCIGILMLEINMQPHQDVTAIAGMQRDVDKWLAQQNEQGVIIEYPLPHASKSQSLYHIINHRQKIVNSYALPPAHYLEIKPILEQWPSETTLNLLDEIGVDYVLVDVLQGNEDFATKQLPALENLPQLTLIDRYSRDLEREDVPTYLFGHIHPKVDIIKEVYLFQLEGQPQQ